MRALIIGATGFIGRHLVNHLAATGHSIICCGRDGGRIARLFPQHKAIEANFVTDSVEDWIGRLSGVDAVINTAGIFRSSRANSFDDVHIRGPLALFEASKALGIGKLVHISALGADQEAKTRFHQSKYQADTDCRALAGVRNWVVVRPSLVIGRGARSTSLFAAIGALSRPLRIGPGNWIVQPVHIDDFVEAVRLILECDRALPSHLDLVGPDRMTTDELTATFRNWLDLPSALPVAIPTAALRAGAWIGDRLSLGLLSTDALSMLERGNVADVEPARSRLGWEPQSLSNALASEPATDADRWHARMFLLKPLLRGGLSGLWIATGIVSAFLCPFEEVSAPLAKLGLHDQAATVAIYAGSVLDIALGGLLLTVSRVAWVCCAQLIAMALFTILATIASPISWLDPFGPLTKNIAVLLATLSLMAVGDER
jgi:nucleoside-diphosphate-sugar epimerase